LFFSYEYRNSTDFEKTFTKLLSFLILAPSITILIFLLFYVVGYNKAVPFGEGENLFLSLLGIHLEKRNIPFINAHPNTIGIYAGATLVMSVIGIWTLQLEKKYHTLLLVNVAICSIFLLVVDSRGTILNTLIAILAVYVLNRIHAVSMLRYVVIISPFLPFIMLFVLSTFADNPLIAQLSRNEGDLETGNSRGIIWQYCLNELMDVKPIHFIGYGANGQVPSGVSKLYAYFFSEEGGDQMITHNYFIQSLFDLGYIGSFMLLAVMYIAITNAIDMYKGRIKSALVLIGFMTYYTLSGTTESTFGVYNRIYNSIFIMVLIFILLSKNEFDYYAAKEE
jgi:O-antigen ligase